MNDIGRTLESTMESGWKDGGFPVRTRFTVIRKQCTAPSLCLVENPLVRLLFVKRFNTEQNIGQQTLLFKLQSHFRRQKKMADIKKVNKME